MPVTARHGCCTSFQWLYVLLWSERRARRAPRARIAVRASARGGQGRGLPAYSSNEGGEFNGPRRVPRGRRTLRPGRARRAFFVMFYNLCDLQNRQLCFCSPRPTLKACEREKGRLVSA